MVAAGSLKNIVYSSSVAADPDVLSRVERANSALVDVLGESAGAVEIAWTSGRDHRGRTTIELTLRDWTGEVTGTFAPAEFGEDSHLWRRLYSLWGDLLRARSIVRLREMREAVSRLDQMEG